MTKFSPLPQPDQLNITADRTRPLALTGKRILIVDDSAACRMVLEAMAKALGAIPTTAETAVQAMVASAETEFDLIILDIGLADADGRVLARTLRETPHGESAAILCVSGLGGQTREDGALESGANAFAEKPFGSIAAFCECAEAAIMKQLGAAEEASRSCSEPGNKAEPMEEALSPHIASCALEDLSRARERLLNAVSAGDLSAARRAGHFISGVASLIGASALDAASRTLETASGDSGALRSVENVLGLTFEAEARLRSARS